MKKLLASVLVAVMVMGLSVTSFAEMTNEDVNNDTQIETYTDADADRIEMGSLHGGGDEIEIILNAEDIKNLDMDDMKLTVSVTKGKELVKRYDLDEFDTKDADGKDITQHMVVVELNDYAKTTKTVLEFDVILKNKNGSKKYEKTFKTKVGYEKVKWEDIAEDDELDYDKELDKINKSIIDFGNAEEIELTGPYFSYFTKASSQDDLYLGFDNKVNKSIANKYPNTDLTFFNWTGKPVFDFTGELTVILPDEDVEYSLYSINDKGELTLVNAKLNDDEDALVFKTRSLGSYVLSDDKLDANAAVGDKDDTTVDEDTTTGDTDNSNKPNPGTGSSDFVGVAAGLAVASVAAVGAVTMKKKK